MAMEGELNDICVQHDADNKYSALNAENNHSTYALAEGLGQNVSYYFIPVMNLQEKKPLETLQHVIHILWTILPTLCCFAIARIFVQQLNLHNEQSLRRFALEFLIIAVPVVLSVNVANSLVLHFVIIFFACLLVLMYYKKCFSLARTRSFELGKHPRMLTLARATINILTAVCILAIDFESFPKEFRKSRRFGAGLMDVGIGLFIFAMGSVSRRPSRAADLVKLCRMVTPVLLLGLARTLVITYINYNQDEHEYGRHLNAFFTLGLTKLIGTLLSGVAGNDLQLVPIGLGLLAAHESALLLGITDFVMDNNVERNTFFTANREGICSLPGFVAIYIISVYIGQMLQTNATLSYNEFLQKLKLLMKASGALWWLVLLCIFSVGIARVTCNFGYAVWILAIAVTMSGLYMFVFDLVLNTVCPVETFTSTVLVLGEGDVQQKPVEHVDGLVPSLVEAVNRNGLTFFLLANILTGGVNIFLQPDKRSNLESVAILCSYTLIATGFVYILYRLKIRIA